MPITMISRKEPPMPSIQEYEKLGYLNEEFRFFYLKDEAMRSFSYHYHEFDKLLVFLSGNASYHIEGKTYQLSPFDIVCIPHGDIHCPEIDFSSPYERYILYISPEFYQEFGEDAVFLTTLLTNCKAEHHYVYHTSLAARIQLETLLQGLKETTNQENNKTASRLNWLYAKTLVLQFLLGCTKQLGNGELITEQKASYNPKMLDIICYINEHYMDNLSVESLAERFFFSRYHLMRQFKEATGYTLHSYISNKRLLAARDAMKTGVPATTAAICCGFHDYSTFSRAYKKLFGTAPTLSSTN